VGAELAYVPPVFRQSLAAVLELDWVRPATGGALGDPRLVSGGSYALSDQQVGILLSAAYRARDLLVPGLTPFAAGGPGLYFHRASVTAFGSTNVETAAKVGFQLAAGADYRLGPGAAFAEVRYHFARVDFRTTGDANVGGFMAMGAGYRLKMF
jgi:opacity protein-like surface antigen